MQSLSDILRALSNLPWALQAAWAIWAVAAIGLLILTINAAKVTSHDEIKDPIFGQIDVGLPYGFFMSAVSTDGARSFDVYAQPSREISPPLSDASQDIVLSVDVTNPNNADMRISAIYVEVLDFIPVRVLGTNPVAAGGKVRPFFCNIRRERGSYRAESAKSGFDYIKLSNGELERIAVDVNTPDPGVYSLALTVEFSIVSTSRRAAAQRVPRLVGFFKS
jgi:hypothetical protein